MQILNETTSANGEVGFTVRWGQLTLSFAAGPGAKAQLTNPTVTAEGLTIGEANRKLLHAHLDAWIERNTK